MSSAGGRGGRSRGQQLGTGSVSGARGGARGGGRGGGRGARTSRPKPTAGELLELNHDVVKSRDESLPTKQGTTGEPSAFTSNYFPLLTRPDWGLYQYRVDFIPDEVLTAKKKRLMAPHLAAFGLCIFDGHGLYTTNRIKPDPMELVSRSSADKRVVIKIRLVSQVAQIDSMTLQFYNLVIRKCLETLKFQEVGRYFFDPSSKVTFPQRRLEVWPGFVTSMRHHEKDVLLCVEPIHKVLRMDSVLTLINDYLRQNPRDYKRLVHRDIVGQVIMTSYNCKTYRIDDIKWDMTPRSTFTSVQELRSGVKEQVQIQYSKYYQDRYERVIKDLKQPLLVSLPRKKDLHRGSGPVFLIPEFCHMTGLTEAMRTNNMLMQELSSQLKIGPSVRHARIIGFMNAIQGSSQIQKELNQWGLKFGKELIQVPGRVLPQEKVYFTHLLNGNPTRIFDLPDKTGDWSNSFKSRQMMKSVPLICWVMVVPQIPEANQKELEHLITTIINTAKQVGFKVTRPTNIITVADLRASSYVAAVHQAAAVHKEKLGMAFVILPNNNLDLYCAVKKTCLSLGVPSQCFVVKQIRRREFNSITLNMVIQMNSKLGGVPWQIEVPFQKAMVIGFDVHHSGTGRGSSVGALVASTSPNLGEYFSTFSFHKDRNELSSNLCADITKALEAYAKKNGELPQRIFMYRDGVSEGQLSYVFHTELTQIRNAIKSTYENMELAKFTFFVVTKKVNTRLFSNNGTGARGNPPPGAVADDVITLPERYDFFLVSQSSLQGTVGPTAYNVLFDQSGLNADKLQRLTYKLCHMYYNSTSTVSVPAPCQYAHKLAYLTGISGAERCSDLLTDRLHYL